MPKDRNVKTGDQATISREQARLFFNMGKDRFFRRWNEHYRHRIRSVETRGGIRLLLTDVIAVAFPSATKGMILDIAHKHLIYLQHQRSEA